MALSCFLLLRILRVAVSSNSRLQLLLHLCLNAINRWGFGKPHHFCHCSHEWMLCTLWIIVKSRPLTHFPFIISAIYSERISPARWFLQCWHALVSRFPGSPLSTPVFPLLPLFLRPRRWLRPQTSHNSRVTPQSPSLSSLSTTQFPVNRNLSSMSLIWGSSIKHGNKKH